MARILRDAATLLERQGWRTGWGRTDTGPVCVLHALDIVNPPPSLGPDADVARHPVNRLRSHLGIPCVADWNDAQESAGPVVAALRAAADEAEES